MRYVFSQEFDESNVIYCFLSLGVGGTWQLDVLTMVRVIRDDMVSVSLMYTLIRGSALTECCLQVDDFVRAVCMI